jgi:hypothetical protein
MFTDWSAVPLVCDRKTTAKVLGISPRELDRRLANGTMQPAAMPRLGRKWAWSKATLQQYVDGGYRQYARGRR